VAAAQVLLVGLGEAETLDRGSAFQAAATAVLRLAGRPRGRVILDLDPRIQGELLESAVAGAIVGCVGQDLYREEKKLHPVGELLVARGEASWLESGRVIGESMNLTRRLVNEPPQEVYPRSFAEEARRVASRFGLEIEVWDQQRLEAEGAGALLAVARGSAREPALVILRHRGTQSNQPPLALVGKGVTFDSGGLSLKASDGMKTMKCDMAGAATVLGTMQAVARLGLSQPVVGIMGLVENLPGPAAMKLGDVLTARNGRTIEVLNTDAEGRLVLADALSVAVDEKAERIIDLATLTGACVVALGTDVAGIMSNDTAWSDNVQAAASACGELLWPLPMFDLYDEQIKSPVADIKNIGDGRWGGAITAAKFLEQFVAGRTWAHVDIAGPAFLEKPKPWCDAGASGCAVRTMIEVVRQMSAASKD
jgi:leucyl aminopeptidase